MAKDAEIKYLWTDKKRTIFGLPISFTRYYITNSKIITQTGCFTRREDEIDIYKITDKSLSTTLGQRIFGVGSVKIISKDKDTPDKVLVNIKMPRKVSQLISTLIEEQRDKYSIRGKDMVGDIHDHDEDSNDDDDNNS